ncbi:MAG: phenylalanine--tRNA ligase subunit beta [Puniceicoccales bacterium]|jgi:phenylalanyl-tRNA synthetase beta chain|nr:phenylalanine--tRNA ligase subunit beta [Puniceicoccales bacterium]
MKVSLQWLNQYADLAGISAEQIASALPMVGLEVEAVSTAGLGPLEHVVVGEILSFEKHPKADRLSVCQVATGDPEPRQIVCGAKNFKAGDRVPVALPGAVLPGGFEIKVSKLRDVDSHGMMCSARELGISDEHEGLLLLTARNLPVGSPINAHFPPSDTVFEISVTANRSDVLGHIGVARDLAAYFRRAPRVPALAPLDAGRHDIAGSPLVSVEVSSEACPYYTVRAIRNVKVGPSPDWLRRDLEAVGLRSVNNVVDATNWVMLETGQPLHAFDAARIGGATLRVRPAAAGEKIKLLDGREIVLEATDTVIADVAKPLVIAGIMGGEDCGVGDATVDIVLESAWFSPVAVRKTSRRVAVSTDSSQRFTRDTDPALVEYAAARAVEIILATAGGVASGPPIVHGAPPRGPVSIEISGAYVRERLGHDFGDEEIFGVFERLGFSVKDPSGAGDSRIVTVPTGRPDVTRPIDLVEEFIRIHGAENIPLAPISSPTLPATDAPVTLFVRKATALLAGRGFAECWHYTLADPVRIARLHGQEFADSLALANPLASDQGCLRPSLLPGLLDALKLNLAVHAVPRRFFEIGHVFRPGRDGALRELLSVAFIMLADPVSQSWKKRDSADFYAAKKLLLDISAAAGLVPQRLVFSTPQTSAPLWQEGHCGTGRDRSGQAELACGLVDAAVAREWGIKGAVVAGEVLFAAENFAAIPKRPRFQDWSPYPPVSRDVAIVVDAGLPAATVLDKVRGAAVKAAGKDFSVEDVFCFDVYAGKGLPEGSKSLAFALTFRAEDRTLTDDIVNKAFQQILKTLENLPGFQVRK